MVLVKQKVAQKLLAVALAGLMLRLASARAQPFHFPLQSQHSSLNAIGCFEFKGTAKLDWPPKETYDVLTHPEKISSFIAAARLLRVVESKDGNSKILEWEGPPGRMEPPGGYKVWARDKCLFNREQMKMSVERFADPPLTTFRTTYQVVPVRRGPGSLITVTDVQCPSSNSLKEFSSKDSQAELATESSQRAQQFIVGVNAYLITLHRRIPRPPDHSRPGETATPSLRDP
jgi:hypothetical protein